MIEEPIFFRSRDSQRTCELYREAIVRGEKPSDVVRYLAELFDVQRPAIWKRLRAGRLIAPYASKQEGGKGRPVGGGVPGYSATRRERSIFRQKMVERETILATRPRVDRDPCPRCGIRGDLGCQHSRNRLGMVL